MRKKAAGVCKVFPRTARSKNKHCVLHQTVSGEASIVELFFNPLCRQNILRPIKANCLTTQKIAHLFVHNPDGDHCTKCICVSGSSFAFFFHFRPHFFHYLDPTPILTSILDSLWAAIRERFLLHCRRARNSWWCSAIIGRFSFRFSRYVGEKCNWGSWVR